MGLLNDPDPTAQFAQVLAEAHERQEAGLTVAGQSRLPQHAARSTQHATEGTP
jgi:hypothetical protein